MNFIPINYFEIVRVRSVISDDKWLYVRILQLNPSSFFKLLTLYRENRHGHYSRIHKGKPFLKDTQEEKQKKEILFSAGVVLTDICYLLLLLLLLSPDH